MGIGISIGKNHGDFGKSVATVTTLKTQVVAKNTCRYCKIDGILTVVDGVHFLDQLGRERAEGTAGMLRFTVEGVSNMAREEQKHLVR